jgi:hypothetical protein
MQVLQKLRDLLVLYFDSSLLSTLFQIKSKNQLSNKTTKRDSKLIHEHDFVQVTTRVKCCITCDSYYCSQCGKLLENEAATLILALTEEDSITV